MIKAVIFDWGGVLLYNPSIGTKEYCAKRLGVNESKFIKIYDKYEPDFQKGKISESNFWKKIYENLEIPIPKSKILWNTVLEETYKSNDPVINIAKSLKKQGYKIGYLSNTEIPTLDFFKKQNYDFLDVSVFSCIEGYIKPEKEIYEITLKKLDVKPEEAIFIDDKEIHTKGAKKLGINTILFSNAENLIKELQNLGISIVAPLRSNELR